MHFLPLPPPFHSASRSARRADAGMNTRSTADQLTTALAQKQLRNRSIPTFAAEDLAPSPPGSGLSTPASDREDSQ